MFYFILLFLSISTITNHCEDQRGQAIQNVYAEANKFFPVFLKRSLGKIDKITLDEAEKAIEICRNYEKANKTPPTSPDSNTPEATKEIGLFVTGTILSVVGINWLCGYEISNMPEEFKGAIIGILAFPFIGCAYITSTVAYDKILHQSCLYKISLIKEKLKESSVSSTSQKK